MLECFEFQVRSHPGPLSGMTERSIQLIIWCPFLICMSAMSHGHSNCRRRQRRARAPAHPPGSPARVARTPGLRGSAPVGRWLGNRRRGVFVLGLVWVSLRLIDAARWCAMPLSIELFVSSLVWFFISLLSCLMVDVCQET